MNLSSLAIFIHLLIAGKAISLIRRNQAAWCLTSLSSLLMMRSIARALESYEGKWEGLALGSLLFAFLLAGAVAHATNFVQEKQGWCLLAPLGSLLVAASDWFYGWLPVYELSFRDFPPGAWGHWSGIVLVMGTVSVLPHISRFRESEWIKYRFLLPVLLGISFISERLPVRFYLPPAVAVEAWCTLGVLTLVRTSLKEESFGRIPMFLVMAIIPGFAGLWVAHKITSVEPGIPLLVVSISAGATSLVAAVMAVLLREEIESSVTRLLSPNLKAAEEKSKRLERDLFSAREALRVTEREALVGEVVLSIAHQIKNPLGPMKGYAQMIASEIRGLDDEEQRERIDKGLRIILEEADRIDHQVHELLTFAGRRKLRKESVDVNSIIERAVAFVSPETRAINVELLLAANIPMITADPDHLHEAFLNLILNAVEAMESSDVKTLTLATSHSDGRVEINVSDTGKGIEADDVAQVFEPFFSRKRGGFGLGLSITRSVIQEMNGRIECRSESGEGTTFSVLLPTSESA